MDPHVPMDRRRCRSRLAAKDRAHRARLRRTNMWSRRPGQDAVVVEYWAPSMDGRVWDRRGKRATARCGARRKFCDFGVFKSLVLLLIGFFPFSLKKKGFFFLIAFFWELLIVYN